MSEYPQMQADGRFEAGSFLENYFRSKYRIEELVKTAGFDKLDNPRVGLGDVEPDHANGEIVFSRACFSRCTEDGV